MKSKYIHDILRERLETAAGIFPPCVAAPSLNEIFRIQWNRDFETKMRTRLAMGFFRYGALPAQIGKNKYDNIESVKRRIAAYEADHNREHLIDVANLCLVEFTVHPEYPFNPSDDGNIHTKKIRNSI